MKSTKIIHLCMQDFGGAGKAAYRLHKGLQSINVNSTMIVANKKSSEPSVKVLPINYSEQIVKCSNVTSYNSPVWEKQCLKWQGILSAHKNRPAGLDFFTDAETEVRLELIEEIREADIIHLHWMGGIMNYPTAQNFLLDKPVIWTLHDMNPFTGGCHYAGDCKKYKTSCGACPQLGSNKTDDLARCIWQQKLNTYNNINPHIVTPSKWLDRCASESALLGRFPIRVIPYGLPVDVFKPYPKAEVRKAFNINQDARVILFGADSIGNERKGFQYLVEAVNRLQVPFKKHNIVLAFFGHVPKTTDISLPYSVINFGSVGSEEQLAKIYSAADVFVLPSLEDNLPNTVLEAMSCGVPSVGFNIGGMPDMIEHDKTGYLVSLNTIDGLSDAIASILFSSPETATQFSENCRTKAVNLYALEVQARAYAALYNQLLDTRMQSPYERTYTPTLSRGSGDNMHCKTSHHRTSEDLSLLSYSRKSHVLYLKKYEAALYGEELETNAWDLKRYQDLLIFSFIRENIPREAKILEVGGGDSRILKYFKNDYECWNIDKLEGVGTGPTKVAAEGYRLIRDYMGNFNNELPDNYFDFVFSISALEHSGDDAVVHQNIAKDINRVLKPGGLSLHCFDIVITKDNVWTNNLLLYFFDKEKAINPFIPFDQMKEDPDLYVMSEEAYRKGWNKITQKTYEEFGMPLSYNILWQKKADEATAGFKNPPPINTHTELPKISLMTPSYNQADFLEECIDSILSQGYPNLEYIVMDGGSTDGSVEIIKKYEKYITYWRSQPDQGQYWAINEGFKKTTGEIMCWLNSDDKYHQDAFRKIAAIFRATSSVEWVTGRPTVWGHDGKLTRIFEKLPLWSRQDYLEGKYKKCCIQQESTFWRRSLWNKAGSYIRDDMKLAGDFELWIRFFRYAQLFTVDALLGGFRYHQGQKTDCLDKYFAEADKIVLEEKLIISRGQHNNCPPPPPIITIHSGKSQDNPTPQVNDIIEEYMREHKKSTDFSQEFEEELLHALKDPMYYLGELQGPLYTNCHRGKLVKKIMLSDAGKAVRTQFPKFNPFCELYFPRMMLNILSDGGVTTCCFDPYGTNVFSSIYQKDFKDIWEQDVPAVMRGDFYANKRCRVCAGQEGFFVSLINVAGEKEKWLECINTTPNEVQIEITAACNYAFVSCHSPKLKKTRQPFLKLDVAFERLKNFLPSIRKLNLYNQGEPLLHRDFTSFASKCREAAPSLILEIATNGMLLHEKTAREIIEAKVDRIIISAHGGPGTENMLKYSQRGADYDELISNIQKLVDLRKEYHSLLPKISLRTILFDWNDDDATMDRLRSDAKRLGLYATWGHYDTDNYHWYFDGATQTNIFSKRFLNGSQDTQQLLEKRELFSPGKYEGCMTACRKNAISVHDGAPITLFTSIALQNIQNQQKSITSWLQNGFRVISLNCGEEICALKEYFPDVMFQSTSKDARPLYIKPLIYLDDLMIACRQQPGSVCGIVNADIMLDGISPEQIMQAAHGSLVFGSRMDISLGSDMSEDAQYSKGFDCFFLDTNILSLFPTTDLCLGMPWWDYYLPLYAFLNGITIKKVIPSIGVHVRHPFYYNQDQWKQTGLWLLGLLSSFIQKRQENISSHQVAWASHFKNYIQTYQPRAGGGEIPPEKLDAGTLVGLFARQTLNFLDKHALRLDAELLCHTTRNLPCDPALRIPADAEQKRTPLSSNDGKDSLHHSRTDAQVNTSFLNKQREFWNINSLYDAMFERVFVDPSNKGKSLEEKIVAWHASSMHSMQQILTDIPGRPEWKVLEIGCGVGRVIKPLREQFARVDGVDISEAMIDFAKQYLSDCKGQGDVYVNNGYDLSSFENKTYDFVYSMITFQHIRSISVVKSYLSEVLRVLKPSGYFKLQVFDNSNPHRGAYDKEALPDKEYGLMGNGYSRDEFTALLQEHGFTIEQIIHQSPWIWGTVTKSPACAETESKTAVMTEGDAVLVSAIVSTYNASTFIRGCLEDLTEQTLFRSGAMEIIVVNSGSEEDEEHVINEYRDRFQNIVYIKTERETMYASWNRGIKAARGAYITNANTDDRHHPEAVEIMARELHSDPAIDLVYAHCKVSTVANQKFQDCPGDLIYDYPPFFAPRCMLHYQFGPQPLWRKGVHDHIGYFNPSFFAVGDYEFNIRFALRLRAKLIPKVLGQFYKHDNSITSSYARQPAEKKHLWSHYRRDSFVFELYRRERFEVSTPFQKAQVLNRLALLAMHFRDPWRNYEIEDYDLAALCLRSALTYAPENQTLKVNLKNLGRLIKNEVAYHKDLFADIDEPPQVDKNAAANPGPVAVPSRKKIGVFADQNNFVFMKHILTYLQSRHEVRIFDAANHEHATQALTWADTVWIEWTEQLTKYISSLPKTTRTVCRLHSYEAYLPCLQEINWHNIDALIFMSRPIQAYVESKIPSLKSTTQSVVLPEGIDMRAFPFSRRAHGNHIAFVGHLIQTKNVGLALQAFKLLLTHNPQYHLHMFGEYTADAGTSPEIPRRYVENMIRAMQIADRITFYGHVSHEEMVEKMKNINYIISTSYRESYGFSILEAMAMGIMPLIHNWPGAVDIYPAKFIFNYIGEIPDIMRQLYDSQEYRNFIEEKHDLKKSLPLLEAILTGDNIKYSTPALCSGDNLDPRASITGNTALRQQSVPGLDYDHIAYLIFAEDITKSGIIRNQVIPLLQEVARKGKHKATLVSLVYKNFHYNAERYRELTDDLQKDAIDVVTVRISAFAETVSTLGDMFRQKSVSLVHCRSYLAAQYGAAIQEKYSIPFIFDARGLMPEETKIINDEKRGHELPANDDRDYIKLLALEASIIKQAACTIVLNEAFYCHYKNRYPDFTKYALIQNFVDTDTFAFSFKDRISIRNKMGWGNRPVFVYSGSFSPWYDFNLIVEWAKQILAFSPGAVFLLLTYFDENTGVAQQQARGDMFKKNGIGEDNICFYSAQSAEVSQWLSAADIALIPHKVFYRTILHVAHPIKFAEFLANGLPILAPDINKEMVDVITTQGAGWLAHDPSLSATQLREIQAYLAQQSPKQIVNKRVALSAVAKRKYALPDVAGKYLKVYQDILQADNNHPASLEPLPAHAKSAREEKAALKILFAAMDSPSHACPMIRVMQPNQYLADRSKILFAADLIPRDSQDYPPAVQQTDIPDIFIMQRNIEIDVAGRIVAFAKNHGKKTIYEIDDLLTGLPADHPQRNYYARITPGIEKLMRTVDAVTVSTEMLKNTFAAFNSNIFVLPNLIDAETWAPKTDRAAQKTKDVITIGYTGSITHASDIAVIAPAIQYIAHKYPGRVSFKFRGCFMKELAGIPGIVFEQSYIDDYKQYAESLKSAGFDFALVPLADNPFNRAKSNIKFLEYAACKIPGIFSNLNPYACIHNGVHGIVADNTVDSWIKAIEHFIHSQRLRDAVAQNAYNEVISKYLLHQNYSLWTDAYQAIISGGCIDACATAKKNSPEKPKGNLLESICIKSRVDGSPPERRAAVPVVSFASDRDIPSSQYIRQMAPLRLLAEKGIIELIDGKSFIVNKGEQLWFNYEQIPKDAVIFLQRDFSAFAFLLQYPFRFIYDLDDNFINLPSYHPDFKRYKTLSALLKKNLSRFDTVTVSTCALKEALQSYNQYISVKPNLIPFIPEQGQRTEDRIRVLISGTTSHLSDVQFLIPVIEMLAQKYAALVEFVFWGFCPSALKGLPYIIHKETFIKDYRAYIEELACLNADIGLIPLEDTEFNRYKSDIKWKEYGICRMAIIASDVIPYQSVRHGHDGLLLSNDPRLWQEHIEKLILNENSRKALGKNAYNRITEEYMLEQHIGDWEKVIESAVSKINSQPQTIIRKKIKQDLVSIIIPVYNNVALTRKCLTALADNTDYPVYEVIIIDNNSTDETSELLSRLDGDVQIIRNKENVGFAKACNQGAQAAQGTHLVFLNNDTVPQKGWLEELASSMEQHPVAGVVGCKLLYPDNTIQHCGASMRYDRKFFRHQYKFLDKDNPLVNQVRELGAVTAACFITPRKLFFEVGMFDEGYVNGAEDMDYCTAVRERGCKVYYNPRSILYHLESQTARPQNKDEENFTRYVAKWGTDQMKNEIEIYAEDSFWSGADEIYGHTYNSFAVQWHEELKDAEGKGDTDKAQKLHELLGRIYPVETWRKHATPVPAPIVKRKKQKILFVCHDFPPYKYAGAQLYALNLAKELIKLGHDVRIFYPVDISKRKNGDAREPYALVETTFENVPVYQINVDDRSQDMYTHPQFCFHNKRVEQRFRELLTKESFDIVHYHLLYRLSSTLPLVTRELGIPSFATLHDYWVICSLGHMIDTLGRECSGPESCEKCAACITGFNNKVRPQMIEFFNQRTQAIRTGYAALDYRFSPSVFLADMHLHYGFERPRVLPLGWLPVAKSHDKRIGENIVFGYAGQIISRKGLDILIAALLRVPASNWQLHIYGENYQPAFFNEIMQAIKDFPNITYKGPFNSKDLPRIYSEIDVAVIPSRRENYPLTLLEALSAGVPVLASDVGGVREMLQDGIEGLVFPSEDVESLAIIINSILQKPARIELMKNSIRDIKTIRDNACEYQELYDSACKVNTLRQPTPLDDSATAYEAVSLL